jgi:Methylmalonic aciduria and homocystinuria type D protein
MQLQREFRHVFPMDSFHVETNGSRVVVAASNGSFGTMENVHSMMETTTTTSTTTATMEHNDNNDNNKESCCEFLALATNQYARVNLASIGVDVEEEKDVLLQRFVSFASAFCRRCHLAGYWADYLDPCSGLPMLSPGMSQYRHHYSFYKVYSEVDGMQTLLNYRTYNAGCCKVLCHDAWGSHVYPATIFLCAPRTMVISWLDQAAAAAAVASPVDPMAGSNTTATTNDMVQ